MSRLTGQLQAGTTTVEAKSGYGLSQAEELRHLRIIGRVAARMPIRVVATFLGAHAKPPDRPDYVDEIVDAMLPAVAAEGLAEFCDVFCDAGFFTVEEAERILRAASAAGLGTRLHADQLQRIGATALAVRLGATSADHLEQLDEEGVRLLAGSPTVATLLPGPALVMRDRLPPARALLDAGATVALASDANAGTFGSLGRDAAGHRPGVHPAGHDRPGGGARGDRWRSRRPPTWVASAASWLPARLPTWWPGMPTMRARSPCTSAQCGRCTCIVAGEVIAGND